MRKRGGWSQKSFAPFDWRYVETSPNRIDPKLTEQPPRHGAESRSDMRALVEELRAVIPAALES